jgi:hypothetical protein
MPRAKKKDPLPRGYPAKYIDWAMVDKLLIAGCTGTQVAARAGVSDDTLYLRCKKEKGKVFSAYRQEKISIGDGMLHATQFSLAMEKDRSMLIWLGKQRLNQKDKHEIRQDINHYSIQKSILELPDNGKQTTTIEVKDVQIIDAETSTTEKSIQAPSRPANELLCQ